MLFVAKLLKWLKISHNPTCVILSTTQEVFAQVVMFCIVIAVCAALLKVQASDDVRAWSVVFRFTQTRILWHQAGFTRPLSHSWFCRYLHTNIVIKIMMCLWFITRMAWLNIISGLYYCAVKALSSKSKQYVLWFEKLLILHYSLPIHVLSQSTRADILLQQKKNQDSNHKVTLLTILAGALENCICALVLTK